MNLAKISEDFFCELGQNLDWDVSKIPECSTPTPDFSVKTKSGLFIAEISSIDYEFIEGKCYSSRLGETVRKKIHTKKSNKQLKGHNVPTLLVLTGPSWELGFESIVAAMYGDLTVNISVESGEYSDLYYGKNSKMQKDRNTSISALGFLTRTLKNSEDIGKDQAETIPHITIYHNMYAKNPFTKDFFSKPDNICEYWFSEGIAANI